MTADPELKQYMRVIARANRKDQIIIRGCITGMFTAFGTVLGLTILVFIGTQLLTGIKDIPFLDNILEQTKLDVVIESYVNNLNSGNGQTEQNPETGEDPVVDGTTNSLRFENLDWGLAFTYPGYLNEIRTGNQTDVDFISFNAPSGALHNLDIFVDKQVLIDGNNSQRAVTHQSLGRIFVNVYEDGAQIDGNQITNPVFSATVSGKQKFTLIGIASPDSPKLAREVFISIVESLSLNGSE